MNVSKDKSLIVSKLPFAGYIWSLDEEARRKLVLRISKRAKRESSVVYRYANGDVRPRGLVLDKIVEIIRKHSGDSSWTGDNLFPVEFYNNKE